MSVPVFVRHDVFNVKGRIQQKAKVLDLMDILDVVKKCL
jgi:hypothetical protein